MEQQRILVELDCLIDTRIGTLSMLNEAAAAKLFGPKYWGRLDDDFEYLTEGAVTNEAYRKAYNERGLESLMRGTLTGMTLLLNGMVSNLESLRINTPFVDAVVVEVNIYPYLLTEEQCELYVTAILAYTGMETPVRIVRYAPQELSPSIIKARWEAVIMYDFDAWITLHWSSLLTYRIPKHSLITAARSANQRIDNESLKAAGIEKIHPFAAAEGCFMEFVGLDMLSILHFCAIPPPPPPEAA